MSRKKIIGQKIRELRKKRGLTQMQLAGVKELGISQASLAAYETGAREPSVETIAALSQFFHVSVDYILGMTERQERVANSTENLSDAALLFLGTCDDAMLSTIGSFLGAEAATDFFEDLRAYALAPRQTPEDSAELFPLVDHLNRGTDAERVALEILRDYRKKLLVQSLDRICDELAMMDADGNPSEAAKRSWE